MKTTAEAAVLVGEFRAFDYVKGPVERKEVIKRSTTTTTDYVTKHLPNETKINEHNNMDAIQKRASFARSPLPHKCGTYDNVLTEARDKSVRPITKSLKSLTTVQSDAKGTVTQRCYVLFQEKSAPYALKISATFAEPAVPNGNVSY